jgi:hypothetical protein
LPDWLRRVPDHAIVPGSALGRGGARRLRQLRAERHVRCRADPCPFKRVLCDLCPFLEQPFAGFADVSGHRPAG